MSHHREIANDLRQAGHRLTLSSGSFQSSTGEGHLTADEILKRLPAYGPINKSCVYRTLDLLARLNLVNPTDFGSGRIEYEIHRHPHHHHLLCRDCGEQIEVDQRVFAPMAKQLQERYGFAADLEHFAVFGLCQGCQK
jgi:Fur family ferric uptake transcriptional regulator